MFKIDNLKNLKFRSYVYCYPSGGPSPSRLVSEEEFRKARKFLDREHHESAFLNDDGEPDVDIYYLVEGDVVVDSVFLVREKNNRFQRLILMHENEDGLNRMEEKLGGLPSLVYLIEKIK